MPARSKIRGDPGHQSFGPLEQALVRARPGEDIERRARCGGGHGVRVVGAGVEHRPVRHLVHDVAPAAECRDGEPAAQRLGHRREVRRHVVQGLGATEGHPEPRDDLVEDQHDARALVISRRKAR